MGPGYADVDRTARLFMVATYLWQTSARAPGPQHSRGDRGFAVLPWLGSAWPGIFGAPSPGALRLNQRNATHGQTWLLCAQGKAGSALASTRLSPRATCDEAMAGSQKSSSELFLIQVRQQMPLNSTAAHSFSRLLRQTAAETWMLPPPRRISYWMDTARRVRSAACLIKSRRSSSNAMLSSPTSIANTETQ